MLCLLKEKHVALTDYEWVSGVMRKLSDNETCCPLVSGKTASHYTPLQNSIQEVLVNSPKVFPPQKVVLDLMQIKG